MNDMDFVATEDKFLKKVGDIYITEEQNNILKKYNIDAKRYKDITSLIFDIETMLNNSSEYLSDLDYVAYNLSEYKYYNNTNK